MDIRHLNLDDKIEASVAKELREVYNLEAEPSPQFRQGVRDGQKSSLFGEYSYKLNDLLKDAQEAGYGTVLFVESHIPMLEDWIGRSPHRPYHPGIYKRKWLNRYYF